MNEYWYYWHEYCGWTKVRFRSDWSALDDVFEHLYTFEPFYKKGMRISVEYGCMNNLIKSGDFMTEEDFNLYKPEIRILKKL